MALLKLVKNAAKSTSCHGVSHLANSQGKRTQFWWLFWTGLCFGCTIFFILIRVSDYLSSTTSTSFKTYSVDRIEMPMLTICSKNTYDLTEYHYLLVLLRNKIRKMLIEGKNSEDSLSMKLFLIDYLDYQVQDRIEVIKRMERMRDLNYTAEDQLAHRAHLLHTFSPFITVFMKKIVIVDGETFKEDWEDYFSFPYSAVNCRTSYENLEEFEELWEREKEKHCNTNQTTIMTADGLCDEDNISFDRKCKFMSYKKFGL